MAFGEELVDRHCRLAEEEGNTELEVAHIRSEAVHKMAVKVGIEVVVHNSVEAALHTFAVVVDIHCSHAQTVAADIHCYLLVEEVHNILAAADSVCKRRQDT